MTAIALTIAGSDSGGGAGIQADLKTFSALGVYGASVLTALTAQNTRGVTAIHDVPVDFITAQIDAVFSDIAVDAVKIGMLSQPDIIAAVANGLKKHGAANIVLDPVMVAESGDLLLAEEAESALVELLFPLTRVVTPNLHEAAKLLGTEPATTRNEMEEQAADILDLGANTVLLKGGHFDDSEAADFWLSKEEGPRWFSSPFIETSNTHGTGCSLSSAIAAGLAKDQLLEAAIGSAKDWLSNAIAASDRLTVGQGAGPVHHFHAIWED